MSSAAMTLDQEKLRLSNHVFHRSGLGFFSISAPVQQIY
jgi:hypothetical protein